MEPGKGVEIGATQGAEQRGSLDQVLSETSGRFYEIARDLQRKRPDLFNPPSRLSFDENRDTLPWPLNQKGAGLYFSNPGGKHYGFQIVWEDESGDTNQINLGTNWVDGQGPAASYTPDQPSYLQDFDKTKVRQVYYERIIGDEILSYQDGKIVDYKEGTPRKDIEPKEATSEQWNSSKDAKRLNEILDGLKKYSDSLQDSTTPREEIPKATSDGTPEPHSRFQFKDQGSAGASEEPRTLDILPGTVEEVLKTYKKNPKKFVSRQDALIQQENPYLADKFFSVPGVDKLLRLYYGIYEEASSRVGLPTPEISPQIIDTFTRLLSSKINIPVENLGTIDRFGSAEGKAWVIEELRTRIKQDGELNPDLNSFWSMAMGDIGERMKADPQFNNLSVLIPLLSLQSVIQNHQEAVHRESRYYPLPKTPVGEAPPPKESSQNSQSS